ncbi:alpha/beta hydrolase [Glaciibacter sp. 2TAF33]|uniref:alpha/beta hydrolase n=1 Tax=Glaciibacter sp. 2TAF33 TaxID=3233015 RepID=UPI003F9157A3
MTARGRLVRESAPSAAVAGTIDCTIYLPPGYDGGEGRHPSLYLLHGRGGSEADWSALRGDFDELIGEGVVPPLIVVMPDAPWNDRGGYYVDSLYTGPPAPGVAVETALTSDLVRFVDGRFRTVTDRSARGVGGNSMGGAGALRYALAHQELFSAALLLSPALYVPVPPEGSSAREFGGYGVGASRFEPERYRALSYPAGFAAFDPRLPLRMFIAVGDQEYANRAGNARHDLDYEAATLYNRAKRVPGVTAEFRVYGGGHDWTLWRRGLREGAAALVAAGWAHDAAQSS